MKCQEKFISIGFLGRLVVSHVLTEVIFFLIQFFSEHENVIC
jgi:hypothetical protein